MNKALEMLAAPFDDDELNVHQEGVHTSVTVDKAALIDRLMSVLGDSWGFIPDTSVNEEGNLATCNGTLHILSRRIVATGARVVESGRTDNAIKSAETNAFIRACEMAGMHVGVEQRARILAGTAKGNEIDREELQRSLDNALTATDRFAVKPVEKEAVNQDHDVSEQETKQEQVQEEDTAQAESAPLEIPAPSKADIDELKALQKEIGDEVVREASEKWNAFFAAAVFNGERSGGQVRSILRAMMLPGFEDCVNSTKRFTWQQGFAFYNEYMGKTDAWANTQIEKVSKTTQTEQAPAPAQTVEEVEEAQPTPAVPDEFPPDVPDRGEHNQGEMFDVMMQGLEDKKVFPEDYASRVPKAVYDRWPTWEKFVQFAPTEVLEYII